MISSGVMLAISQSMSVVKSMLDATKPPLQHPEEGARIERTLLPRDGEARLEDYL